MLVEYTGNKFPACGSTGEVKGANLGYLSGGKDLSGLNALTFKKEKENAVTWWGDRQATIDYCKVNLPRICREFGGIPTTCLSAGFPAVPSHAVTSDWRMMKSLPSGRNDPHDHFDGQNKWGYLKA